MGQKVHPTGIRLGITQEDRSNWFAGSKKEYAVNVYGDYLVREFLEKRLNGASVSRIQIERPGNSLNIVIHAARPGVIIGKKGGDLESLRAEIAALAGIPVQVSIQEIKKPDMESVLVAESVAQQLEKRVAFRRAVKRAIQTTMRQGAKGIKVSVSGRLGGAEIARTEWYKEGSIPLHTFRADIDYGTARAQTTYGVIGVKVWIYKGDKLSLLSEKKQADQAKADSV
jgi:small subunit ribosomal protein S3